MPLPRPRNELQREARSTKWWWSWRELSRWSETRTGLLSQSMGAPRHDLLLFSTVTAGHSLLGVPGAVLPFHAVAVHPGWPHLLLTTSIMPSFACLEQNSPFLLPTMPKLGRWSSRVAGSSFSPFVGVGRSNVVTAHHMTHPRERFLDGLAESGDQQMSDDAATTGCPSWLPLRSNGTWVSTLRIHNITLPIVLRLLLAVKKHAVYHAQHPSRYSHDWVLQCRH